MFHPTSQPRKSYVEETLAGEKGLFIAASDYVRALPEQISRWVPGELFALGTDGMGRSETRETLRRHFEVDAQCIAYATLYRLFKRGEIDASVVTQAIQDLGINPERLRIYEHPKEKLSHYSKRTADIEYKFEFAGTEWGELEGIANRTDFDLKAHSAASGKDLSYFDQEKNERWTPFVIEPAAGVDRATLTFLMDAFTEDEAPNSKGEMEKRAVLKLDYRLAPIKVAVLPLSRNADLSPKARDLAAQLRKNWNIDFDDAGAIGRRYRRQDEIGTPYCITVDFETLEDHAVTIRDRDTMSQERIALNQVEAWLAPRLLGC
jgi:glycyl-tRNA synthetase (class II)